MEIGSKIFSLQSIKFNVDFTVKIPRKEQFKRQKISFKGHVTLAREFLLVQTIFTVSVFNENSDQAIIALRARELIRGVFPIGFRVHPQAKGRKVGTSGFHHWKGNLNLVVFV